MEQFGIFLFLGPSKFYWLSPLSSCPQTASQLSIIFNWPSDDLYQAEQREKKNSTHNLNLSLILSIFCLAAMSRGNIPSGFIKASLQNGLGRYVCQLKRLTISFCKERQDSQGARWVRLTERAMHFIGKRVWLNALPPTYYSSLYLELWLKMLRQLSYRQPVGVI